MHEPLTLFVLEIQRHTFFVAIGAEEIGALFADPGRTPLPGTVSGPRLLHLDDFRPEVSKHHRAVRARQHPRKIDDPDAI